MNQEARKTGRHTILGERGENIDIIHWDQGATFGATWHSPLHDDHVIMTHAADASTIRFADTGMTIFSVTSDATTPSFAEQCTARMFERLVTKLSRVHYDAMGESEKTLNVAMQDGSGVVRCEERG